MGGVMLFNLPASSRKSSSDRFIPRRAGTNFDLSYYYIRNTEDKHNVQTFKNTDMDYFINTVKHSYNLKRYRSELWKTMMPDNKKILNFSSPKKADRTRKHCDYEVPLWPIHPRSKPLLMAPSIILDMPDLDSNICHHVVDWGKQGYIATIYENEVHLWHPEQKLRRHVTNTHKLVQHCVKWNREGTHLAMALNFAYVGIWDCDVCKTTVMIYCQCSLQRCVVTAMEWTKNNTLITGCSFGRLCCWNSDFDCTKSHNMAHKSSIINIKFSCSDNYVATTGLDRVVRIWKWPEFLEYFQVRFTHEPVKGLTWHPWRNPLLVMGGPNFMSLWNVNTQTMLSRCPNPEYCIIDSLTFNPISAELVVSYYNYGTNGNGVHLLTVLKDLDKVIDQVQFHYGRVPYLLWDTVGTKLATASADENLCIWEFFGTSTTTEKFLNLSKKKEFSTDMLKNLNIFNKTVR